MHEVSLIQSLIKIVEEHSATHGFKKVSLMRLSFGRMTHIEPKALELAFKVQSEGTVAFGATLEFKILPVIIYCFKCNKEYEVGRFEFTKCPGCGADEVQVVGGTEELQLLEMDVD
ncbi:MAG: hydrogenase maturation nickel metallochaperone HypA [Deltaproteobacteria bacterium]|uniref:Hydrogenase maturation factor HypA n=1 Tax=Candidatus Zymogenus saltonus TaxID=2844893 RepID=A0A9D8PQ64_9DELT|nr:hydrogenase maturation nickel metallochaperone HypA [Candidatus Zymogenus saltonus]